jgi:hypothetical protein
MARTTEITSRPKTGIGRGVLGFKNGCIISAPDERKEPRSIRKPEKWIEARRLHAVKMCHRVGFPRVAVNLPQKIVRLLDQSLLILDDDGGPVVGPHDTTGKDGHAK